MTASSAALEAALEPFRARSNREVQTILDAYEATRGSREYPSGRTLATSRKVLTAGKRYRYTLACLAYQGLTAWPDFEVAARPAAWLELYHVYTLFLDDIMDEDERRRTLPSSWSTTAKAYRGKDAAQPGRLFRSVRQRYGASMAILDALRIRSLAERAIQGAEDLPSSVRVALLSELTDVDLVLSDGQGLDIDFEILDRVPEADYVRMSEAKTARLYLGAAATAAIAAGAGLGARQALEEYALRFAIAFQDRDDLLGSGVVASRIGGSSEGDIRQGKRTRLYVLALDRLRGKDRASFLRAYGRGRRSTKADIALIRRLLRDHVLPVMEARISENLRLAREALDRIPPLDSAARDLLDALLDAQRTRVR